MSHGALADTTAQILLDTQAVHNPAKHPCGLPGIPTWDGFALLTFSLL